MTEAIPQKRSFGERVNTWVQIVGILIAAGWGVYTFYIKEFVLPKSVPVNISLNLQLKKIETGAPKEDLTAVEMKISATNPSSRKIYLLPTAWIAYAANSSSARKDETTFTRAASDVLKDPRNLIVTQQRFVELKGVSVLATGHLFHYDSLKPGETIGRTLVFFIPKNDYNFVSVSTFMPTAEDISEIRLEWTLDSNKYQLVANIFSERTGKPIPMGVEKDGRYSDERLKRLDLQQAESSAEIVL